MNRARKSRKSNGPIVLTILLLVVIGVGLFGIYRWQRQQDEQAAALAAAAEAEEDYLGKKLVLHVDGEDYALRSDLDTYLIIGLDKFTDTLSDPSYHTNNQQADFLFLMVVDKTAKSYTAIHLNRDAMTEIQRLGMSGKKIGTFTGQLALSHTFGSGEKDSCRNTVLAVSRYLLDVPVEHYFSLTMDAIPMLNDLVGGVTVHIDDNFSAIDPSLEQGKDIRLKGQQALTFVRSRHHVDDGSNLSRMNRQREYIRGLYEQISKLLQESDSFARSLASHLADFSVSDLTTTDLANLADQLKDYRFTGIRTIAGEAKLGEKYIEFYTDEDALQSLVLELFFQKAKS